MPTKLSVVEIKTTVGELLVTARVEVEGPVDQSHIVASLGERIERAIRTAIANYRADFSITE